MIITKEVLERFGACAIGAFVKIGWAIRVGLIPARIRADLTWADLTWANLSEADLGGARWNSYTVWPTGFLTENPLASGQ